MSTHRVPSLLVATFVLATAHQAIEVAAQTATTAPKSTAQIHFTYENAQLNPARYSILVDESGRGHYHSEPGQQLPDPRSGEMPSRAQDAEIVLSPPVRDYLFQTARDRKFFAISCEDGTGKIAYQGMKVLTYDGVDGTGRCTYNWSKDLRIDRITRIFEGISTTLEVGGRLALEHRHDRLALDHELEGLALDAKEGRALELTNIAEQLQAIADDETIMQRARSRATMLLKQPVRAVK